MKRHKPRKKTSRKGSARKISQTMGRAKLRLAGNWSLLECIIAAKWRERGQIVQVCVARQSSQGEVFAGAFVVDLGCLGVKNAYAAHFHSAMEYRRLMRSALTRGQEMMACDLDLAAKVIDEAVKYAGNLGFKPNRDIKDALLVMGETHPEMCAEEIPLGGEDGKPLFIAGPYDDPDRVMRILDRAVGEGNYQFIVPMRPPGFFDDEFDEIDEWDEDDE